MNRSTSTSANSLSRRQFTQTTLHPGLRAVLLLALLVHPPVAASAQPIPDLQWEPESFRYESGTSPRYIDYANGDDSNPGTKEEPWKHHPWDAEATELAADTTGIHTYVFRRGVVYRGSLNARDSGEAGNPVRLTADPNWGQGAAMLAGSMRVSEAWKRLSQQDQLHFPKLGRDKIWFVDLDIDFSPRLAWLVEGDKAVPLPIAREPDWEVTNPNYPMADWWIWTDQIKANPKTNKRLVDEVNLVNPDPGTYTGAMVRAEQFGYAGYGHPTRIKDYRPSDHSVSFTSWVPSMLRNGREPSTNCRYYLEDKPQFLDSQGEFYFDPNSNRLYVRLPGDRDPNTAHIEIARHPVLIDIRDKNHIEISGLSLRYENINDWFDTNEKNAAIRVLGNCTDIKISHCSFEHVIKALSYYPLRDGDVGDFIELTDSEIQHTDQNAVALSHGCGGMWGFQVFPKSEPQGHLRHVSILRNNVDDIGHRPAPGEACHAIQVKGGELVEIAHNVVNRTYGSGISACNSRFTSPTEKLKNWESPLNRILVHHNCVTNTLLQTNDWGGIACWGVGPSYVFNNISGNAVGHRGFDYIQPPKHEDNFHKFLGTNFGCAYYFDHCYKSYAFNNVGWGTNNRVDDEFYSATGFMESFGILNHLFNNTFYRFSIGQTKSWGDSSGCRYLGNLYLDIGSAYIFLGVPGSGADLSTTGYGRNLFHGDVESFALGQGQKRFADLHEWRAFLDPDKKPQVLQSETGTVLSASNVRDAQEHDFRLKTSAAGIDKGVKVFAPWGLYKVVGEWPFFENRQNPARILDEHLFANDEWKNTKMFTQIPRHDLTAYNIDAGDYQQGVLEDWVDGALNFNGIDQYCTLPDSVSRSDYSWTTDSEWTGSGTYPGEQRVGLDAGDENFLIEAVFRTRAKQTGGTLVSKGDDRSGYHLVVDQEGKLQLQVNVGANNQYRATSSTAINDDQWHHIIAEVDRSAAVARIYIDGQVESIDESGSLPMTGDVVSDLDFTVGRKAEKSSAQTRRLFDFESIASAEGISVGNAADSTVALVDDVPPSGGGGTALRVKVVGATKYFSVPVPEAALAGGETTPVDLSAATSLTLWVKSDISSKFNLEVHDSAGKGGAYTFQLTAGGKWTEIEAPKDAFTVPRWSNGTLDWSSVQRLSVTAFGEPNYDGVFLMLDDVSAELVSEPKGAGHFRGSIDYLRLSKGTLEDAQTTIEELYDWQFDGPFLRDFFGNKPTGARRDVGAVESP